MIQEIIQAILRAFSQMRFDYDVRQREHTVGESSAVQIGRNNERTISVKFRNCGQNSLMTVNAGSSQGEQLRPGEELVYSVPFPGSMRTTFQVNYAYENQNPILPNGTQAPTRPNGNATDAKHLGVITEIQMFN
jgi:hypothetical protein